jgi:hypothetical protein
VKLDKSIVYVGFTRGSSLISRLIRWGSEEPVNHTFLLYYDGAQWAVWLEHGAINGGFVPVSAGAAGLVNEMVHCLRPPVDLRIGMRKHTDLLGSKYDWAGLIGMIPVEVAERVGKKISNPFNKKASNFCSEAVAIIVGDSGAKVEYDRGEKPSTLNPGELLRAYLRAGWVDEMAEGGVIAVAA